ncbi:GNAT family N-acetyltransferase [Halorarum halophilum]|uniref:GNAT family N-acetyltransferase n=1 Tax=Halorarum halophilum TaxID=2743090 RepID=A0A7D5KGX0_9EURY|nr:GNAT family N-acetyltransferase [Halobaculum halophilum]QLG28616.1 GNAT family N-acetyltransferase [Halobaculum halophilum]
MDLRDATPDDVEDVRAVANASLEASYGHVLSEGAIEDAVESWYETEELSRELDDDDAVFVVAEEDGEVVGFVQSYFVDRRERIGQLDWLHVHPDHRGHGVGSDLLRRVEAELLERGATRIEGRVLVANESGTEFYAEEGFTAGPEREVEIGGETFSERLYTKFPDEDAAGETVTTEERVTADGRSLFVAYDEAERASKAPFYPSYSDSDRTTREGYFCGNCESFSPLVDSMGTVECPECGNRRKPTRWDAAYL